MATRTPYLELGKTLAAAIRAKGVQQKTISIKCGIDQGDLTNFLKGRRSPTLWGLGNLAAELGLDPVQLLLLKFEADAQRDGKAAGQEQREKERVGWERFANALTRIARASLPPPMPTRSRDGKEVLSLAGWPFEFQVRTALVGDRRESPPHTLTDVLVLPASTGDLTYFADIGLRDCRIRSDKIVKIARAESLRTKLNHDILVIGSPASNLAARVVNADACFRFSISAQSREHEARFEHELEKIAYDREALADYLQPATPEAKQRLRELHYMLQYFARPGFIDPVDYADLRGANRRPWNDFGIVTLCRHPWSESGVAILAAGIGGPGTAAALKLLATPGAFAEHPLGGVFDVGISNEAPWEDRYDLLKPKWNTHPYDLDKYQDDLERLVEKQDLSASLGFSADDAAGIFKLIELLKKRASGKIQLSP